jgi:hypothetical protein
MNSSIFWDIKHCSLLKANRRFACRLLHAGFLLDNSSALNMVAMCSSEKSVSFQWPKRRYTSLARTLHELSANIAPYSPCRDSNCESPEHEAIQVAVCLERKEMKAYHNRLKCTLWTEKSILFSRMNIRNHLEKENLESHLWNISPSSGYSAVWLLNLFEKKIPWHSESP